ncbi:hypothetical protein SDC9_62290 [bioreactor metagenome]|uniref:Secretion system C-terminal sorting domain-containing protein n=1 Tax=bioreactor metagenome TaxID=1076179 RepID=A0A644XI70_9ZZZZ
MKTALFVVLFVIGSAVYAQPTLSWQKTYGGTGHEYSVQTIPMSDGGFVFVGHTESSDNDVPDNSGGTDLWVARADASGTLVWSYTYGGTEDDEGASVVQASDGTLFVAGWTDSNDGDVTGNHGTYSSDFWVLHLSSSGTIMNKKCFGGTDDDDAAAISITPDGRILVAGTTYSYDGDVSGNHGTYETDVWVIALDTALNLLSQKCIGGSDYEEGINMCATADNGCVIAGRSYSTDGDVTGYHDGSDMLVAKLSSSFSVEWAKCFGGSETEEGNDVVQNSDGSFTVLGYTSTHNNGDVTGHYGASGMDDFWLVKLTSGGVLEWAKCYGGSGDDQANGLAKTADGGYVMCGLTNSTDGQVSGFHTGMFAPDIWLSKVSSDGTFMWQRCCGGTDQDEGFNVYEESANVYVATGFTYSVNYDITSNHGSADGWILRITGVLGVEEMPDDFIRVYPNPAHDVIRFESGLSGTVCLTDMQGRIVYKTNDIESGRIALPELKPGLYGFRLSAQDCVKYSSIVIY